METHLSDSELEDAFRDFVMASGFPCLGAKAAVNSDSQTVRVFDELAGQASTDILARALSAFDSNGELASFIAIFREPRQTTEIEFEKLLWKQLRLLQRRGAALKVDPSGAPAPNY